MKEREELLKRLRKTKELYFFLLPAIVFYIIFKYVPIYGLQMAFRDFSPALGFWKSPWIGLENFNMFFSGSWSMVVINTLKISVTSLALGFPIPVILALMLHHTDSREFKRTVQMVTYAPHFISSVVLVGMIYTLFSPSSGVVNTIIQKFGMRPVFFMGRPELFVPMYVGSGIWQSAGWSAIVYIAALSGVSPELHESAIIDGATKFQRIIHVDLPSILPAVVTMFLLSVGYLFSVGFDKVYLMQNPLNQSASEVISILVYKRGLLGPNQSFAAAIGFIESAVNMCLLVMFNRIAKIVSGTGLW
ncbi:MAG: ABC transporter permease subunit [Treponema sp.]|jgi:putative aldouronate transport system permease protein|nr:ABC transporter permease subunit [Treponema sp.]